MRTDLLSGTHDNHDHGSDHHHHHLYYPGRSADDHDQTKFGYHYARGYGNRRHDHRAAGRNGHDPARDRRCSDDEDRDGGGRCYHHHDTAAGSHPTHAADYRTPPLHRRPLHPSELKGNIRS
jgi:hypothetical protein